MWGEKNIEPKKNTHPESHSTAKPSAEQPQPHRSKPVSTVGHSVVIQGSLKSEEDMIIYGTLKGEVELKNNNLSVGKSGRLEANVLAKSIRIEGQVVGDIYALHVSILKTGAIFGNIISPRVILEDGAKFKGSIDMDNKSVSKKLNNEEVKPEMGNKPKLIVANTNGNGKENVANSEK